METKFFVMEAYRYKESGKWEYNLKGMEDTLEAAKQIYYSRMGAIIKSTNDFAMVILYDNFGNKILSDFVDTSTQPEPEQ